MSLFLDTSALVKLFVQEPGSEAVERAVESDSDLYVGPFVNHEFTSAIQRKRKDRKITVVDANLTLARFRRCLGLELVPVPFSDPLARRALALLERHGPDGLRTLDAFQMAACLERQGSVMVTADGILARIAQAQGISTRLIG